MTLDVGESWMDDDGWLITRLDDRAIRGGRVVYRWHLSCPLNPEPGFDAETFHCEADEVVELARHRLLRLDMTQLTDDQLVRMAGGGYP